MKDAIADVRAFHEACDVPVAEILGFPSEERAQLRVDLLEEETGEFSTAVYQGDLIAAADAIADVIYVAIGAALEFGIPLDRVWSEVHRSNMAKRDPVTGKVRRREDGKVLKPEGWTPPNVGAALGIPGAKHVA